MSTYTGNYTKTYTVEIAATYRNQPVYPTKPGKLEPYSRNSVCDSYLRIAGFRVHKTLVTSHVKTLFANYEDAGDFILHLNKCMKEENVELNPYLEDYKALLKSLLIGDSFYVWEIFKENVPKSEQSYLFWVQLAEDADWGVCKKALKKMPSFFMMRFLLRYADESSQIIRNERLEVISKRKDNYGLPPKVLLKTVRILNVHSAK